MKKLLIILLAFTLLTSGLVLAGKNVLRTSKPLIINSKLTMQLKAIGRSIARNKNLNPGTLTSWKNLIKELQSSKAPYDIHGLIQTVLSESYKDSEKELELYKLRVKYFSSLKREIRKYTKELRNILKQARLKPGPEKIVLKLKDFSPAIKFARMLAKSKELSAIDQSQLLSAKIKFNRQNSDYNSSGKVDGYIQQSLDDENAIEDDAILVSIALQNALKKQQKTLQLLNVIKVTLFNAAMTVKNNGSNDTSRMTNYNDEDREKTRKEKVRKKILITSIMTEKLIVFGKSELQHAIKNTPMKINRKILSSMPVITGKLTITGQSAKIRRKGK